MALTSEPRHTALVGQRPRRRGRRIGLAAALSLLIHCLIGLFLLVTIRRDQEPELLPPPSPVTMVFESGRRNGPTEPEPSLQATAPGSQTPPMQEAPLPVPPLPPAVPSIVPPAASPPAGVPAEPVPPTIVGPSPPVAEQVPPPPSAVDQEPVPAPPTPNSGPVLAPPAQTRGKQAAPANQAPFPPPMNFSFGTPQSRAPAQPRSRPHVPGTIDMSLGPAAKGDANATPFSNHDEAADGADWRNALSRWVAEHAYYPEQARRYAEEGNAKVHVVAQPNGRVTLVELIGRSGSTWLDLALLALFRDQHIPPLPFGVKEPVEFDFTMHYILVRPR